MIAGPEKPLDNATSRRLAAHNQYKGTGGGETTVIRQLEGIYLRAVLLVPLLTQFATFCNCSRIREPSENLAIDTGCTGILERLTAQFVARKVNNRS